MQSIEIELDSVEADPYDEETVALDRAELMTAANLVRQVSHPAPPSPSLEPRAHSNGAHANAAYGNGAAAVEHWGGATSWADPGAANSASRASQGWTNSGPAHPGLGASQGWADSGPANDGLGASQAWADPSNAQAGYAPAGHNGYQPPAPAPPAAAIQQAPSAQLAPASFGPGTSGAADANAAYSNPAHPGPNLAYANAAYPAYPSSNPASPHAIQANAAYANPAASASASSTQSNSAFSHPAHAGFSNAATPSVSSGPYHPASFSAPSSFDSGVAEALGKRRWGFGSWLLVLVGFLSLAAVGLVTGVAATERGRAWLKGLSDSAPASSAAAATAPFDPAAANRALERMEAQAGECLGASASRVKGRLNVRFGIDGKVKQVNLEGDVASLGELPCVRSAFEAARVRPFAGKEAQVQKAVELAPPQR